MKLFNFLAYSFLLLLSLAAQNVNGQVFLAGETQVEAGSTKCYSASSSCPSPAPLSWSTNTGWVDNTGDCDNILAPREGVGKKVSPGGYAGAIRDS